MEKIYGVDQQILDERGIGLTVSQVVNLSSSEYSARLRRLCLSPRDEAFVRRLRRRIKNRMASQNSRRRTAEHIKSLRTELRAVRAGKQHALDERRELIRQRDALVERCCALRTYILQKLSERSDPTPLPIDLVTVGDSSTRRATRLDLLLVRRIEELHRCNKEKPPPKDAILDFTTLKTKDLDNNIGAEDLKANIKVEEIRANEISIKDNILNEKEEVAKILSNIKIKTELKKVEDQVMNHGELPKIVRAKCVSIETVDKDVNCMQKNVTKDNIVYKDEDFKIKVMEEDLERMIFNNKKLIIGATNQKCSDFFSVKEEYIFNGDEAKSEGGVLDLCVKSEVEQKRRQHGRKQAAPRRLPRPDPHNDAVLDLKIRHD